MVDMGCVDEEARVGPTYTCGVCERVSVVVVKCLMSGLVWSGLVWSGLMRARSVLQHVCMYRLASCLTTFWSGEL